MSEHDDTIPQRKISRRRPFIWIGIVMIIVLVLVSLGVLSMHAQAANTQQGKAGLVVVITNSGSTNSPASTVTVYTDGSGKLVYQRETCPSCVQLNPHRFLDKSFPAGTFAAAQLETVLTQIKDVSTIPNRSCLKSISFGSSTTITYNGKTSGDVSCLIAADGKTFLSVKEQVEAIFTKAVRTH